MALTTGRLTPQRGSSPFPSKIALGVKTLKKIYIGSAVVTDSTGYALAPTATTGLTSWGVALNGFGQLPGNVIDNSSGSSGDLIVEVGLGEFKFDNSVGDALAITDIGAAVYWEDDHTVCKTGTGKSLAGYMTGIDASTDPQSGAGIWVMVGRPPLSVTGSAGATGPTGPTGSTGPTGPTGA